MAAEPLTYKDAGVDLSAGDALAHTLRRLCSRTHSPRVLGAAAGGTGLFRLDFNEKLFARNYKEPVLVARANGVGSKVKLAAELGRPASVGRDVVALCVNDLLEQGAEPLFFLDALAVHQLDPAVLAALVQGISDACLEAGCALLGGATDEMPSVYRKGEFDVAGFAVGVAERSRLPDGATVEPGDSVLGLASNGLHANGYALVRRICIDARKAAPDAFVPELGATLADELLRPTRVYARSIHGLLARYTVKRVVKTLAHVAAGGLTGTLPRMLAPGLAVRLKRDGWPAPPIFAYLQQHGPVDQAEMLRVFNMGIGFLLIVRPAFTKPIMTHLRTLGEKPYFLGKVRKAVGDAVVEWA
jgi:phosphoribosylformylglycinamidine cyclo-ligase